MEKKSSNTVLYISAAIILLFVALGVLVPDGMNAVVSSLFSVLTTRFGWLYLIAVAVLIFVAVAIAASRYGKIKLGKDSDKPEFTTFQWYSMLFSGGMGIGLVFWSVAEPMIHYQNPPMGTGGTPEAMREAMTSVFFHWGVHAWVIFAVCGLALAYFQFRKNLPFLISSSFHPLIGDKIYGPIGKAIDILAVFATVFGVATSLGLGSQQIATGLSYIFGVEPSAMLTSVIIAIMTIIFTIVTISGLHKAMQIAADIKVWLCIGFMVFIFIFGGMTYILDILTDSFGNYLQTFIGRTFWMGNKPWLGDWTIFYWAWWISWAPFVGQFIARISKGRTIREFIIAVAMLPAGFSLIWLSIYGGAAFNIDAASGGAIMEAVSGDYTTALFALLKQMPAYVITGPIAVILVVVSFVGAANSATYVLAMLTSGGNQNPSAKLRGFWGIAQGAMTIILILASGTAVLKTLQTAAIASAFPFMFVMLIMCFSIFKALKNDSATL